jgi:hypothetical protein
MLALLPATGAAASTTTSDTFQRSLTGSWGTGALGAWAYENTSGTSFTLSVDGKRGVAREPGGAGKGNLVVGPSLAGTVAVVGTFTYDHQPDPSQTQNHWQVLLRHQGSQTYYAAELYPNGPDPATLVIFTAKSGVFTDLGEVALPFAASTGSPYRVKATVSDVTGGVRLSAKAWPGGSTTPGWELTVTDTATNRITSGSVGVRFSTYAGPATATLDNFAVTI